MKKYLFVNGDLYNDLFVHLVSDMEKFIIVDGHVWNRIADSLPKEYRIPESTTTDVLNNALALLEASIKEGEK